MDPSRIERSGAAGTRRRFVASLLFGRQRASLYVAYGLGVVLSAMALGVPADEPNETPILPLFSRG